MRNVKISLLAAAAIGFFSLIGCSKSNNNNKTSNSDSVFTSSWTTLNMTLNPTDSNYEQTISAPAITSAILNDGVVLGYGAYLNQSNDTVVEQALEFDMFQTFSVGNILLQSGFDNSGLWYRYVIIPGHVLTTRGITPVEARSMNYAEIMKTFPPGARKSETPSIN
ncbi:MAG TPA: hypothetical protein VN616_16990 [Puia sp.]|nr:hypothetical protein [Puia sp.]